MSAPFSGASLFVFNGSIVTPTPGLVASKVKSIFERPEAFAAAEKLAAEALADPTQSNIDALRFPTDADPIRPVVASGEWPWTEGQTVLLMSALVAAMYNGVGVPAPKLADPFQPIDIAPIGFETPQSVRSLNRWERLVERLRGFFRAGDLAAEQLVGEWLAAHSNRLQGILEAEIAKVRVTGDNSGGMPKPAAPDADRPKPPNLSPTKEQDGDRPDGPEPPDALRWKGVSYAHLSPTQWKILNYLWPREAVTLEDFARAIWPDEFDEVSDGRIRGRIHDLNGRLEEIGVSFTFSVSTKDGFIRRQ